MRPITAGLAIVAASLLCSCAGKVTEAPGSNVASDPGNSAATETAALPTDSSNAGFTDWLALSVPDAGSPSTSAPAFDAYGYRIGSVEYEAALKDHLAGAEATPAARDKFNKLLRERLLILAWLERSPLPTDPNFRAEARARLRAELADDAFESLLAAQSPRVADAEVRALYEQRKSRYRTPEMARIRIIQVGSEDEARKVRERLQSGEDFGNVAREVSRHASRTSAGEIEPFPRGTLGVRELEDMAFKLEPGELGSLGTPSGYFVVKKIGSLPEQVKPFSAVEADLRAELQRERDSRARTELLARIERELSAR